MNIYLLASGLFSTLTGEHTSLSSPSFQYTLFPPSYPKWKPDLPCLPDFSRGGRFSTSPDFQGQENNLLFSWVSFVSPDHASPSLLGIPSHLTGHLVHSTVYWSLAFSSPPQWLNAYLIAFLATSTLRGKGTLQIPWVHHHSENYKWLNSDQPITHCDEHNLDIGIRMVCHFKFSQPYLDHTLLNFFLPAKVVFLNHLFTLRRISLFLHVQPGPTVVRHFQGAHGSLSVFFPGSFLADFLTWLISNSAVFASAPRLLSSVGNL